MDLNGKLPAEDYSFAIRCSYCGNVFCNIYFLQLHLMTCTCKQMGVPAGLTAARSVLEDLGLLPPPVANMTGFITAVEMPVIQLRPNYAYWEHYRRQGCNPPLYNFMGLMDPDGAGPSEPRHPPRDAAGPSSGAAADHNGAAEQEIARSSTAAAVVAVVAAAVPAEEQARDPLDLQLAPPKI